MNTVNYTQVLNELENNCCIYQNGDSYEFILSKDLKRKQNLIKLNSQEVSKIASVLCGSLLSKEYDNIVLKLTKSIEVFSSKLLKTKRWYQKISSSFGYKSKTEKAVDIIKQKLNIYIDKIEFEIVCNKIDQYYTINEKFKQQIKKISQNTIKHENLPLSQLTHYYLGIIEPLCQNYDEYDGCSQEGVIKWYFNHLNKYYKEMKSKLSNTERLAIENLMAQYSFTYDICLAIEVFNLIRRSFPLMYKIAYELKEKNYPYLVSAIIIKNIKDKLGLLKIGEKVVLPGGYIHTLQNKAHSVIYSIEKISENNFSFRITNTGSALSQFEVQNSCAEIQESELCGDIVYANIPYEKLNCHFFKDLIHYSTEGGATSMKDIYLLLNDYFGKPFNDNSYKMQTKGSCSHKAISVYSHRNLPEKLYRDFKTWMTVEENFKISKLQDLDSKTKQIADIFLKHGEEILIKRQNKLSKLSQSPALLETDDEISV